MLKKFGFVPKRKDSRDLNVDNHGTEHDCDLDEKEKSFLFHFKNFMQNIMHNTNLLYL